MDRRSLLAGLFWDVGLPAAAYYGCRAAGLDARMAMLAGGLIGLFRVVSTAVRQRRLNGIAALTVAAFLILLVFTLLTDDDRILLTRESILTGVLGVLLLGSCLIGRPLMYHFVRRLNVDDPQKLARWDQLWRAQPQFRRVFFLLSAVWGAGLLLESVVRIPLVYLLPVDVMAGLSSLLLLGTIGVLFAWTIWYRRYREHKAADAPTRQLPTVAPRRR